jgi:PTS system fructose-specific IIA component/PTS system nitrogen regulatory IIA component
MEFASLIPPEVILDQLKATEKEVALGEMTQALVAAGRIDAESAPAVVEALMSREELGSTGIGKGVAVPHAKHESVRGLVGAFARSREGIEFAALDGQPVHLVFLLLSSKDTSGQHLEALAKVARLVRDDRFCRFLREAKDEKELAELLQEADARLDTAGAV